MTIDRIKELFNMKNALSQELVNYIIIYLRKSRKDSEFNKEESIEKTLERHETMLQDYAKSVFGCKIPENNIFREVVSGDTIADRPEMQKVLDLIESDDIKAVLCIEIERLARGNSIDQGVIAQKFQLTNTKIITLQKIFDLDDEYDMSFFEEGLHQSRRFLQYTKKILKRGREQSAREGKFPGSKASFGYDSIKLKGEKGNILVKNKDNYIIRKLFDIYLYDNLGTTNTAKKLNELGLPCASGGKWDDNKVRRILEKADFYSGTQKWGYRPVQKKYVNGQIKETRKINENCIKVKGRFEPTITKEEEKLIKERLKQNAAKNVKKDYELKNPLANLVKCSFCRHNMTRRAYYTSCAKNGELHKDTLLCRTIGCKNVSSDLDIVEERILEYLKIKLKNYETILKDYETNTEDKSISLEKDKDQIQKKIETIKQQKQKACVFLETGTYDEETFKIRIAALNKEIEGAEKAIKKIEEEIKSEKKEKYVKAIPILKNCIELYDKVDIKQKNELLSSIIEIIYYKKTNNNGRWDPKARTDFTLEIKLKI